MSQDIIAEQIQAQEKEFSFKRSSSLSALNNFKKRQRNPNRSSDPSNTPHIQNAHMFQEPNSPHAQPLDQPKHFPSNLSPLGTRQLGNQSLPSYQVPENIPPTPNSVQSLDSTEQNILKQARAELYRLGWFLEKCDEINCDEQAFYAEKPRKYVPTSHHRKYCPNHLFLFEPSYRQQYVTREEYEKHLRKLKNKTCGCI